MKKLLCGLAALPFLAGVALAQQPTQLTNAQMDTVTAGWDFYEIDISNTSATGVSVYKHDNADAFAGCNTCYISVASPAISVASLMIGYPLPHVGP